MHLLHFFLFDAHVFGNPLHLTQISQVITGHSAQQITQSSDEKYPPFVEPHARIALMTSSELAGTILPARNAEINIPQYPQSAK